MQVHGGDGTGAYTARFADVNELVEVYTRQLVSGALFVPLEKLADEAPGAFCTVELQLPIGAETFRAEGTIESVSMQAPRGVRLRLLPLDDVLRGAIEVYITQALRGETPSVRLPPPPAAAIEDADTALAFQEEATGLAAEGRSIQAQLREMTHNERIRLALSGGKAARAALIRNPQPVYHPYVVQNPRITNAELAAIAKNPNVAPEALRMIAGNAQHMSDPSVRFAIVKNPKTDAQLAQKLLPRLTQAQLRQLARSEDVRANLRSAALRLTNRSGRG
jgi:hypothetical protein